MTTRRAPGGFAVEELTATLRTQILDGDPPPGTRLVERELVAAHGVARHTLRAALRALAAEGLVQIEPNRGARVAAIGREQLTGLFELRTALEVEACRLALARDAERLRAAVRAAASDLRAVCEGPDPPWSQVVEAHAHVHTALVDSAESARLAAAYAALDGEMRLFLMAMRPAWTLERMADHHDALAEALVAEGETALRRHLDDGRRSVLGDG
jgi:DNA-binding GntR family transcriptional regulator